MGREISIGSRKIGEKHPVFIIAEIGINHNGDVNLAKNLIELAAKAGVDCVKFQMRNLASLYSNAGNANDAKENLSTQYTLDLLSRFELSPEDMFACFDHCKKMKVIPLCTPWDLPTLELLENYGMEGYKIASADLTNHELLAKAAQTGKPLIISTGMSFQAEIESGIRLLNSYKAPYALLHCNSTYPPHMKDIHLNFIPRLAALGDHVVGYSGHERGGHIPLAAIAMGARIIEKHFTIDKNMEGNDHKVSLLPDEMEEMVKQIRDLELAMGEDTERKPNQGELMNRVNLAKSLMINCELKAGEIIRKEMLEVKSPGRGLQPMYIDQLVGTKAKRDLKPGDFFFPEDISKNGTAVAREYSFKRKWGIPVRYHDSKILLSKSNPDFLEFHLSYKDMDEDFRKFFNSPLDLDLTVHSPDTFAGDHLLNLASDDEVYRARSIKELQRVVNLTRELKSYFKKATEPLIIVSVGGFSKERFFTPAETEQAYKRVADSLSKIDQGGVKIIPQTLPPFPWYFGGQLFCNLFVNPDDTAAFCRASGYQICFDISHSKLAANHLKMDFNDFVKKVAPYSAHLHIVDAAGLDSEGLQIDEGEIDFEKVATLLNQLTPAASFIPEIWMGHENEGEKQWIALERLEKYEY